MSNSKLISYQNANTEKYEYLEPFKANNCYLSTCVYNIDGSNRLPYYFQSPRLYTPTGIYKLRNEYKLDLIIPLDSPFLEYLINEDDKNIQVTTENSQDWFDEHFTIEEVGDKYKTSLIFNQNGEDPILRVNIPSYRGKPTCEVFDIKSSACDWMAVQPNTELVGIVEKVGIKFYKEVLTGEYELHKIKVFKPAEHSKLPKGYMFDDANDSNDNDSSDDNDDSDDDELNGSDDDDELNGSDDDEEDNNDSDDDELNGSDEDDDEDEEETDSGLEDDDEDEEETDSGLEDDDEDEEDPEVADMLDDSDLEEVDLDELSGNTNYGLEDEEDSDTEDFDLSNINSLNAVNVRNTNNLDDELESFDLNNLDNEYNNGLESEDEDVDEDVELDNIEHEGGMEIEQVFEGGHDEELNESNNLQIEDLTDDELELNLTDDETDDAEEEEEVDEVDNELDEIDLNDLEEYDLSSEIKQDISRSINMIEPEELTDDELELNL